MREATHFRRARHTISLVVVYEACVSNMDAAEELGSGTNSEQSLNELFVSINKEYPVLIEKSVAGGKIHEGKCT